MRKDERTNRTVYADWKKIIRVAVVSFLFFFCSVANAEFVVHQDEQKALLDLLKIINTPTNEIVIGRKSNKDYEKYADLKQLYIHSSGGYNKIKFYTDKNDRIIVLYLSRNSIPDFSQISNFKHLREIEIRDELMHSLRGVDQLTKLQRLTLVSVKTLKNLNDVHDLPNLETLEADFSLVEDISGIKNLPSLKRFSCDNCKIKNIKSLSDLKGLKELVVGTSVVDIDEIGGLSNLDRLEISGDNLKDISAMENLLKLRTVVILDSKIKTFPNIDNLSELEKFRILESRIESIPSLEGMKKLKSLAVSNSNLKKISGLKGLPQLKIAWFGGNPNLKSVSGLSLANLEELNLSRTNIASLENLGDLPNLRKLDVSKTKLTSLKGLEKLPRLWNLKADPQIAYNPENREYIESLRGRL